MSEHKEAHYEVPAVTVIGTVQELTLGSLFAAGQDYLSQYGSLFGS